MRINNNNLNIFLIVVFSSIILLKFIYIFISDYFNTAIFVGGDAYGLFKESILYGKNIKYPSSDNPLTYFFFVLGKFYFFTFQNYIWASTISIIAWFISFIYLFKSMKLLQFSPQNIFIAVIIFSFTPSIFTITSTTLREVWQLLFVNMLLYYFIKFHFNHKKFLFTLSLFIILTVIFYVLHRALIIFGLFSIILIFYVLFLRIKIKNIYIPLFFIISFILLLLFYVFFSNFYIDYGWSQLKKGIPLAVQQYQQGVINSAPLARGNYINQVSITNYIDLLIMIPFNFLQYLFEPIFSFSKINSIKDIVAVSENLIRLFLIILFLYKFNFKHTVFLYIFILYVFIELLWSLGTINWGTALRHHVPSIGLLIMCSLYNNHIKLNS